MKEKKKIRAALASDFPFTKRCKFNQSGYSQFASLRLTPSCHFVAFCQEHELLLKQKIPARRLRSGNFFVPVRL
jgi:hypothetical protein